MTILERLSIVAREPSVTSRGVAVRLLRREREVGYGARSVSRSIELTADTLAWQAERLGLRWSGTGSEA